METFIKLKECRAVNLVATADVSVGVNPSEKHITIVYSGKGIKQQDLATKENFLTSSPETHVPAVGRTQSLLSNRWYRTIPRIWGGHSLKKESIIGRRKKGSTAVDGTLAALIVGSLMLMRVIVPLQENKK